MTDSHLGHMKLLEHGVRQHGFTEEIINAVHESSGDLLIHLGDVCIGNDDINHRALLIAANKFRKKVLVRGNHDGHSDNWYYERGWDFVCRSFTAKYFGKNIIFTHKPFRKTELFDLNIHGHLHGAKENSHRADDIEGKYDPDFHIDVAPELRGYAPVKLQNLI